MKKSVLIIAVAVASFTFSSCKKESVTALQAKEENTITPSLVGGPGSGGCPATEVSLLAGQTINSGSVTVTNDANYIYVTYTTTNGWFLTQTHLYVGECSLIPVNNPGNPMPGQFPYKTTHTGGTTTYTYQVPIATIGLGNCGCIAAHAVVVKLNASGQVVEQQTGWGNGTHINLNGGNWGMKFDYCTCTVTP